jgi:SagB-type dehydrogenase family enzyme
LRFKRAKTIVLSIEGQKLVAFNYLTTRSSFVHLALLNVLLQLNDWKTAAEIGILTSNPIEQTSALLLAMLEADLILAEGTLEATRDDQYTSEWEWGIIAGLYHFAIKNANWVSQAESDDFIASKYSVSAPPGMFELRKDVSAELSLKLNLENDPVLSLMAERRSSRDFSAVTSVPIDTLSDCLFSGLGITDVRGIPPLGPYPLKMTPSGGARNPFVGMVYIRNVTGIEPGLYEYSGFAHSLTKIPCEALPSITEMLGGQHWAASAAAVIFLVANLERTMWKYPHPTGYRVILIEAGHIAQNVVLMATRHRVRSVTTAAIKDDIVEDAFGLESLLQSACYAIALGNHEGDRP